MSQESIDLSKPYNKVLNPVVHRWNVWKQDKWAILNAAQNERQRLMQEVAEKQKVIKQLTEIMEQHNNRAESWESSTESCFATL